VYEYFTPTLAAEEALRAFGLDAAGTPGDGEGG
jgi:hypothetical protein